jgi:hypothetical protein
VALVRADLSEESISSIISVLHSLVTANIVPSALIFFALMLEAVFSSETSVVKV